MDEHIYMRDGKMGREMHMATAVVATSDSECQEDISTIFEMCLPEAKLIFCRSGAELLDKVSAGHFEIIIIDFTTADKGGFNLIKQTRACSSSPIVVFSYDHSPAFTRQAIENGADRCFSKPIRPFEFAAHLRALLRRS